MRRDFDLMKQFTTVPMQALRLEIERSMLSEELRVLYVALTRAKERIFITGTATKIRERLEGFAGAALADGKLPAYLVRGATSSLDWLLMSAVHHPGLAPQLSEMGICADQAGEESPLALHIVEIKEDVRQEAPVQMPDTAEPDTTLSEELERRLAFVYPFAVQTKIPTKMAVSQIAKGDMAKSYRFARRPSFLLESGLTAAQKGNALHKFMQFADYRKAAGNIGQEIERLAARGFLSREEASVIDRAKLEAFFAGPLAARIFVSEKVYRELRFLAEVGKEVLGEYTDIFDDEGRTAIQGVADCVFLEDGQAVIVDYKSDAVKEEQELVDRYRVQLALYKRVLAGSLGVPVKECVIYSFALSREIALE